LERTLWWGVAALKSKPSNQRWRRPLALVELATHLTAGRERRNEPRPILQDEQGIERRDVPIAINVRVAYTTR
jgi:hypothetical protein